MITTGLDVVVIIGSFRSISSLCVSAHQLYLFCSLIMLNTVCVCMRVCAGSSGSVHSQPSDFSQQLTVPTELFRPISPHSHSDSESIPRLLAPRRAHTFSRTLRRQVTKRHHPLVCASKFSCSHYVWWETAVADAACPSGIWIGNMFFGFFVIQTHYRYRFQWLKHFLTQQSNTKAVPWPSCRSVWFGTIRATGGKQDYWFAYFVLFFQRNRKRVLKMSIALPPLIVVPQSSDELPSLHIFNDFTLLCLSFTSFHVLSTSNI